MDSLLGSSEFDQNPYPVYERLRREAPVYWSERWSCWVLTRYADIAAILQNSGTFSNHGRVTNVIQREFSPSFLTLFVFGRGQSRSG